MDSSATGPCGLDMALDPTDIKILYNTLTHAIENVEDSLVSLEDREERRKERKKILKSEFEYLLYSLNVQDTEMVGTLRANILQTLLYFKKEANILINIIKDKTERGEASRSEVAKFNLVVEKIEDLKKFSSLEVGTHLQEFRMYAEKSIYVRPKTMDPKNFKLYIRPYPETNIRALIQSTEANDLRNELIQSGMEITYYAINPAEDQFKNKFEFPIFRLSLLQLLNMGKAMLVSPCKVEIYLDPSPTNFGMLDVKLMGVNILDGGSKNFSMIISKKGDNPEESMFLDETKPDILQLKNLHTIKKETTNYNEDAGDGNSSEEDAGRGGALDKSRKQLHSHIGLSCHHCPDRSCFDLSGYNQQKGGTTAISSTALHQSKLLEESSMLHSLMLQETSVDFEENPDSSDDHRSASCQEAQTDDFRLRTVRFVEETRYECRILGQSCTRSVTCLEKPVFFALSNQGTNIMVSEPEKNRIGFYEAEDLLFKGWFTVKGYRVEAPRNMLKLGTQYLALICSKGIDVFRLENQSFGFVFHQSILGGFRGLACGKEGELCSVLQENNSLSIRAFKEDVATKWFTESYSIDVEVPHSHRHDESAIEELVYSGDQFYITDSGRSGIYIVDYSTQDQTRIGFTPEDSMSLKPTGLLVDAGGCLLVADPSLKALFSMNQEGGLYSETTCEDATSGRVHPFGLIRHKNTILVSYRGKNGKGGIIRYRILK